MECADPVWLLLRSARRRLGYSQYQVTRLLVEASGNPSVTREDVSRWERGKRIPGPYWRQWLATVLRIAEHSLATAARRARHVRRRVGPVAIGHRDSGARPGEKRILPARGGVRR